MWGIRSFKLVLLLLVSPKVFGEDVYLIQSLYNEKCVDWDYGDNNNVHVFPCHSESNQFWYMTGEEELKSPFGSECLDYNYDNGNVYMYACHGNNNQKWTYDPTTQEIKSKHDGKCLDMNYGDNNNLYMYDCHGGENQKYRFVDTPKVIVGDNYLIKSQHDGKCVDWNLGDNNNVHAHSCHSEPNQVWYMTGEEELKSPFGSECLDYDYGNGNVYMYACHGNNNQKWTYDPTTQEIKSKHDGKCLDYNYDNNNLYMHDCHGEKNQKYKFEVPPFRYDVSTDCKANGKLHELQDHDVACGTGEALNGWRGSNCDGGFKVDFHCDKLPVEVASFGGTRSEATGCNAVKDASLENLDRHIVGCGENQVLQEWWMNPYSCPDDNYEIKFRCANVPIDTCSTQETQCDGIDGKDLIYLDRHDVKCPAGQYLKGWKLTRDGCEGGDQRVKYDCCSVHHERDEMSLDNVFYLKLVKDAVDMITFLTFNPFNSPEDGGGVERERLAAPLSADFYKEKAEGGLYWNGYYEQWTARTKDYVKEMHKVAEDTTVYTVNDGPDQYTTSFKKTEQGFCMLTFLGTQFHPGAWEDMGNGLEVAFWDWLQNTQFVRYQHKGCSHHMGFMNGWNNRHTLELLTQLKGCIGEGPTEATCTLGDKTYRGTDCVVITGHSQGGGIAYSIAQALSQGISENPPVTQGLTDEFIDNACNEAFSNWWPLANDSVFWQGRCRSKLKPMTDEWIKGRPSQQDFINLNLPKIENPWVLPLAPPRAIGQDCAATMPTRRMHRFSTRAVTWVEEEERNYIHYDPIPTQALQMSKLFDGGIDFGAILGLSWAGWTLDFIPDAVLAATGLAGFAAGINLPGLVLEPGNDAIGFRSDQEQDYTKYWQHYGYHTILDADLEHAFMHPEFNSQGPLEDSLAPLDTKDLPSSWEFGGVKADDFFADFADGALEVIISHDERMDRLRQVAKLFEFPGSDKLFGWAFEELEGMSEWVDDISGQFFKWNYPGLSQIFYSKLPAHTYDPNTDIAPQALCDIKGAFIEFLAVDKSACPDESANLNVLLDKLGMAMIDIHLTTGRWGYKKAVDKLLSAKENDQLDGKTVSRSDGWPGTSQCYTDEECKDGKPCDYLECDPWGLIDYASHASDLREFFFGVDTSFLSPPKICKSEKQLLDQCCFEDHECESGHCYFFQCSECGFHDLWFNWEDGGSCGDGKFCDGDLGDWYTPHCKDTKPFNDLCILDKECDSGHCAGALQIDAFGGAGGHHCSECGPIKGADMGCGEGHYCTDPWELDDWTLGYKCQPQKNDGELCSGLLAGYECKSGVCNGLTFQCVPCGIDTPCADGRHCDILLSRCIDCPGLDSFCGDGRYCDWETCKDKWNDNEWCTPLLDNNRCKSGNCKYVFDWDPFKNGQCRPFGEV